MVKSKEYMSLYRARGFGTDFEALAIIPTERGEVKVLVPTKGKQNKPISNTLAKNRIYANIDWTDGHVKELFLYDSRGEVSEHWNIRLGDEGGHAHFGSYFHVHFGLDHKNAGGRPLTREEMEFVKGVDGKWRAFARQNSPSLRQRLSSRRFNLSWMSST